MGIRNYLCGIALIFAMCSCGPATVNNKTEQGILNYFDKVTHFDYKGHKYISFVVGYKMGIVHDPDCSCNSIK